MCERESEGGGGRQERESGGKEGMREVGVREREGRRG